MRVLIIAEACNPDWTSVPLVGWSHSRAIAGLDGVEAHIVTQVRNKKAFLSRGLVENKDFTIIDSEKVAMPFYKLSSLLRGGSGKGWTTVTAIESLVYPYFEHIVWKKFGEQIKRGKFDVVHRLTPLSPTSPSLLAKRCYKTNTPFVVGPLNGGVSWPKEFSYARKEEKEWLSYVRGLYRLMPGYKSTRRYSSAIIVGSKDTWKQVPEAYQEKCVYQPENAIDPDRFPLLVGKEKKLNTPLNVAFVGRLVPYKGVDMLIEAMAPLVKDNKVVVNIYGDGPEFDRLNSMIIDMALVEGVKLHGFVAHDELHNLLGAADIFGFPSVREFGGGVILEAMALGVVPVVVDYAGPSELVNEACGYKVKVGPRDQIIDGFRKVLTDILSSEESFAEKQQEAIKRVDKLFTWDKKAEQTKLVYEWVINKKSPKPVFDFG